MSEPKKVKVISVTGNGSWEGSHGTMYSYIYTLENERAESGEFYVNHKADKPVFKAGDEPMFEPNGQDQQGNNKAKLSKESTGHGNYSGNGKSKKVYPTEKEKFSSFALSYAKDLRIAQGIDPDAEPGDVADATTAIADKLLLWLTEKSK